MQSEKMGGGAKKTDDVAAQASDAAAAVDAGAGFPVGATLVARWMGQVERTCVVIDRSESPQHHTARKTMRGGVYTNDVCVCVH